MPHVPEASGRVAEATLVIDRNMRICSASDAAQQLLGYSSSLQDVSLAWLLPPSRQGLLSELHAAFRNGGRVCIPGALMREDGRLVGVMLTTSACTLAGAAALRVHLTPDELPVPTLRQLHACAQPAQVPSDTGLIPVPASRTSGFSASQAGGESMPPLEAIGVRLTACLELLRWLDDHVLCASSQDSAKQRGLGRVALHQATELLEACRSEVNGSD